MSSRWLLALPFVVLVALFGPAALGAGWVLDDAHSLAVHQHDGQPWGEWTHATYAWSKGTDSFQWRPLPAWLQHLMAMGAGRVPEGFRVLNMVAHMAVVAVGMGAIRAAGASTAVTALAGAALVLHPAVAEVVPWSSCLPDILLALVLVGAAWRSRAAVTPLRRAAEAVAFAFGACLCKESAPALVPALALAAWAGAGRRAAFAAGAGAAAGVGLFLGLHRWVTGQEFGDSLSGSVASWALAGLDLIGGVPTLPARATAAHLFDGNAGAAAPIGLAVLAAMGWATWSLRGEAAQQRRWLAAWLGMAGLCVPAAVGIPLVGVQASRYLFVPWVWLVVMGAGPLAALVGGRRFALLASVGVLVIWGPRTALRVAEYRDTATLFEAEWAIEPGNAYARANVGRHRVVSGIDRGGGLSMWASAIDDLPPGVQVPDLRRERWDLGQAAFLAGSFPLALEQVSRLRMAPGWLPPQIACLEADSLDGLGRHEEATVAAKGCR